MQVERATVPGKKDNQVKLSTLKPGDVFRYAHTTFEEALHGETKDGGGFWQVVDGGAKKAEKVAVVSVDGKAAHERDGDHLVVVHQAKLSIQPNELVDA